VKPRRTAFGCLPMRRESPGPGLKPKKRFFASPPARARWFRHSRARRSCRSETRSPRPKPSKTVARPLLQNPQPKRHGGLRTRPQRLLRKVQRTLAEGCASSGGSLRRDGRATNWQIALFIQAPPIDVWRHDESVMISSYTCPRARLKSVDGGRTHGDGVFFRRRRSRQVGILGRVIKRRATSRFARL